MANKQREYIFKLPYTPAQYRKGQRYLLATNKRDNVTLVSSNVEKEDGVLTLHTHKRIDANTGMPAILKRVLNRDALLVNEYSTNTSPLPEKVSSSIESLYRVDTHYISEYYDSGTFKMSMKTEMSVTGIPKMGDAKSIVVDHAQGREPCIYVHRMLDITLNKMLLAWTVEIIKKQMKKMLEDNAVEMIEKESQWINMSEEELTKLEEC